MIKIFKKTKILEKSKIRKLIDFINRNRGSTFFQILYSSNRITIRDTRNLEDWSHNHTSMIIHLINIKVETINMAIVAF
jgi:hypothetical protein